jgi:hypothetical protein
MVDLKIDPENFQRIQWLLIAVLVYALYRFTRTREPESGFKPGGPAKRQPASSSASAAASAAATSKKKARMLLDGVVLTGLPHQILGIREDASEFEIRKAHRNLIKRFHPDKVGPEGSREWYEAQRAAEAINGAREAMLSKLARS